eukprot:CAMPEP_0176464542 /NCGR_PEP_ID=MMETSP0127-20121128/36608_1 /TAXON_ID=938130 /ORGANISM="Platyophrya macrostoma, Strain WH" /LENGTH=101 /DNA_ID=CAMNT_0017857037 /DNA_START=1 /DNA_END=302 /DNA_ORIENTATION=+
MLQDLLFVVAAVAVIVMVARGAYNVAVSGFLTVAFGALACAALLSMVLSAAAATLLRTDYGDESSSLRNTFAGIVLSAFAQPTLTGIALLGAAIVGGYGCA